MTHLIAGLGNPGAEYEKTRHNTGRRLVDFFRQKHGLPPWREDKKLQALISRGRVGQAPVLLILPQTMMNRSGKSLAPLCKSVKQAEKLLVVYDDLDLPLGRLKLSFNRGSGGHRGLESVIKSLKTKRFGRLRVGISSSVKKPPILGRFTPAEETKLKRVFRQGAEALVLGLNQSFARAMTEYN